MTTSEGVTIGSRGSKLALWQSAWVQKALLKRFPHLAITVRIIKTTGDKVLDSPLSKIGDKGLFTREIEMALYSGDIDIAVHSLKDVPTELPQGLTIAAVCEREDVRDVFIPRPSNPIRTLLAQTEGAIVATGSLRRRCQLLHLRPDFRIVEIRGNLDTRLKKLESSDWAGMLLARAGVMRLGWEDRIGETLDPETVLPAVGQGALGIEIRKGDTRILGMVERLHHTPTARAVTAERALLHALEGGCQIPIGTFARIQTGQSGEQALTLDALVGSLDGKTVVRGKIQGKPGNAEVLGEQLAQTLLASGAERILQEIRTAKSGGVDNEIDS